MLGIKTKNNNIIRPLLCVSRLEIEAYLSAAKQSFREDSSNKSVKYLRNKIRHELIPLLTEMNPSIQETISNEIEILEGEGWQFQIQNCLPWLLKKGMVFRIRKEEYHRLIKGATPLKCRICNYG